MLMINEKNHRRSRLKIGIPKGMLQHITLRILAKKPENFIGIPEKAKRREIKEIICKPR